MVLTPCLAEELRETRDRRHHDGEHIWDKREIYAISTRLVRSCAS